jgi:RNA recognition motif-containing protein
MVPKETVTKVTNMNVFIGNLPENTIECDFYDIFRDCLIRSIELARTKNNQFRGFAFVEFEDLDSLETALRRDGWVFDGRTECAKTIGNLVQAHPMLAFLDCPLVKCVSG